MANPLGVDHIICLTLDKRIDLAHELQLEFTSRGYSFEKFVCGDGLTLSLDSYNMIDSNEFPTWYKQSIQYPSWHKRPNAANAWRAHQEMMRRCLDKDYKSVLFLEDDACLMNNFDTALPAVEEFASNNEWSLFYLGNFLNPKNAVMVHPLVAKVTESISGFHCIALKRHIMQKLIKWPMVGPMDHICSEYLVKYFDSYACIPPLVIQSPGFSFVENHYLGRRVEDNYH